MIVHLITEGLLEEAIGEKLITHCGHECGTHYPQRGAGNVKNKAHMYMSLAKTGAKVLVLTDFMDADCPCLPAACEKYLHNKTPIQGFLLRFAVNEIESWVMADRGNFAKFLRVPPNRVPLYPEREDDPKQTLVNLARKSKLNDIKKGLVPKSGNGIGPEYNAMLSDFIMNNWDVESAMENSDSLRRCVARLSE